VEYNQLDPLLRSSGQPDGDVNDPNTGFSPFPGNINQLLFKLKPYVEILERTKGLMPEFVNPKYKDDTKTMFKSPTRLECMMQDFPTVLEAKDSSRVGFTSIDASLCFSPVKNATEDGVKLQASGTAPGTAASGEADQVSTGRLPAPHVCWCGFFAPLCDKLTSTRNCIVISIFTPV
jgi:UDP-sugar pyrophosphorylase